MDENTGWPQQISENKRKPNYLEDFRNIWHQSDSFKYGNFDQWYTWLVQLQDLLPDPAKTIFQCFKTSTGFLSNHAPNSKFYFWYINAFWSGPKLFVKKTGFKAKSQPEISVLNVPTTKLKQKLMVIVVSQLRALISGINFPVTLNSPSQLMISKGLWRHIFSKMHYT